MSQRRTPWMLQVYESSDHGIFRVDDVFVTGMLAEKANVSHRDISDLITFYEDWDEEVSLFVYLFTSATSSLSTKTGIKRSVVRPNVVVPKIRRICFTSFKCYTDICKIFVISAEFAKVWSVQKFL